VGAGREVLVNACIFGYDFLFMHCLPRTIANRPGFRPMLRLLRARNGVRVVAGILWNNGRYLAVRRPAGKHLSGWWEFPGGKVEPGESLYQGLGRELREELGITLLAAHLWRQKSHRYPDLHVHLWFYWVTSFQGTPWPREGQEWVWVVPGQDEPPFLEADRHLVTELKRFGPPRSD